MKLVKKKMVSTCTYLRIHGLKPHFGVCRWTAKEQSTVVQVNADSPSFLRLENMIRLDTPEKTYSKKWVAYFSFSRTLTQKEKDWKRNERKKKKVCKMFVREYCTRQLLAFNALINSWHLIFFLSNIILNVVFYYLVLMNLKQRGHPPPVKHRVKRRNKTIKSLERFGLILWLYGAGM